MMSGIGSFLERYWGDCVGLYLISGGVALVMIASVFTAATDVDAIRHVGETLIVGGMGVLKLRPNPKNGGNNNAGKGANVPGSTAIAPVPDRTPELPKA